MNEPRKPDAGRELATLLALGALLMVAAGLVGLTAMVMPSLIALPLLFFAFAFVGGVHYLTWGWWMSRRPPADED